MRRLYHFPTSPFSRRARLALAHKGLEVELRDARQNPAYMEEVRAIWALRTVPVLVEADGRVVGDSSAIAHYLDAAYPSATPLWPTEPRARAAALSIAALVDGALDAIIDTGTRYYALNGAPAWRSVVDERMARAQGALGALAEHVGKSGVGPLTPAGWCAADMTLFTAIAWLEGLPARASTSTNIAQVLTLPWSLPAALSRWADAHRDRADVRAL